MATTYNIVRRSNADKRETHYDPKEAKPLPPMGNASIDSVGSQVRARRVRNSEAARVSLVAAIVLEWESACTAGDIAWQCHVIAEMCAAGGIGLAAAWEREIE